jgi:hypothetical protein
LLQPHSLASLIDDIFFSLMNDDDNENTIQNKMLDVYEEISSILGPLNQKNESRMLCIMYKALNDAESFELCVDLQIKDEESRSATLDRPGFSLLHKNLK